MLTYGKVLYLDNRFEDKSVGYKTWSDDNTETDAVVQTHSVQPLKNIKNRHLFKIFYKTRINEELCRNLGSA